MKTTKEIMKEGFPEDILTWGEDLTEQVNIGIKYMIEKAQKDAWNSALDWAAENAGIDYGCTDRHGFEVDKESILEGKNEKLIS